MTDISKLKLPEDTVIGTHEHGDDLYIIYVRSVLRIPNYRAGNTEYEEAHTLELQDYYSYDYPILANDLDGRLWCHIGDRLFAWQPSACRWIEKARFYAEKLLQITDHAMVFANHLQYDENPHGTKTYNYHTETITLN